MPACLPVCLLVAFMLSIFQPVFSKLGGGNTYNTETSLRKVGIVFSKLGGVPLGSAPNGICLSASLLSAELQHHACD